MLTVIRFSIGYPVNVKYISVDRDYLYYADIFIQEIHVYLKSTEL